MPKLAVGRRRDVSRLKGSVPPTSPHGQQHTGARGIIRVNERKIPKHSVGWQLAPQTGAGLEWGPTYGLVQAS